MKGFFDLSEVITETTDFLCSQCGLDNTCISPKMPSTGEGRLKTLIIAEAPGKEEDERNKQLVGEVGIFFRNKLSDRGLDLDRDFWKINALNCRPPKNREPSRQELVCCFPNIEKALRTYNPKFVWLMGEAAIESWFMTRYSDLKPARWRGLCIPDLERGVWVVITYHPSFAKRNEDNPLIMSQYNRDLDFAIENIKTRHDLLQLNRPDQDAVVISKDFDEVCTELEDLIKSPPNNLYFDYETTGLKPFRAGHKIYTVSFCADDLNKAFAFPLQAPNIWTPLQQRQIEKRWKDVLLNKSKKSAHNISFEDVWSRMILMVAPRKWHWDTMIGAHVLDNRQKYAGLKFQAFLHFGTPDYSKEIDSYLEEYNHTGFNQIHKIPINKLLKYNGLDSLYGRWLMDIQKKDMDPHLEKGMDLFTEGTLTFADIHMTGVNTNKEYYKNAHEELEVQIEERRNQLLEFDECKQFLKVTGREPNLGSSDDLRYMFFSILGIKPPKVTEKGNLSVDADTMSKIDSPLAKEITDLNRIKKTDSTYITQFLREIDDDGRIHSFFNLGTVRSYRGSSDRPNLQNTPVRNKEAKRLSRSGIIPSKGFKILDWDYKAIEVRMGACYTLDPALIKYINDPSTDMHKDTASDIFLLKPDKVTKDLRFYTKNGFVFPEWYGSYYKNCAINIWRACSNLPTGDGITVLEHLESIGLIKKRKEAEDIFIRHVKDVEKAYWKKFHVFKDWQEELYKKYERDGTIELFTGFRCKGYLGRNELVNYLFQGTAFHCLLWSVIQINAELCERDMRSRIIAQIHDNAILDCPPEETKAVYDLSTEIATSRIRIAYPWIKVPLLIDWEETGIDESWYSKKEIMDDEEE